MAEKQRREHGSGSVYQRADGTWIGRIEAGYTATGNRRRLTVTGKTEAAVRRKIRDKLAEKERGQHLVSRTTVKAWADQYLELRRRDLSPKGYNAMASPVRKWIIPTIGHRRLDALTPGDVRAIHDAQRKAGRQPADTHRVLLTMLRAAVIEGHQIAPSVLLVKVPKSPKSDRQSMTIEEGLRCIQAAGDMPNGSRWLFTLLYGQRMGECLGLTWDALDLDAGAWGEAIIEWQLQALPYNKPRDRSSGFRVPDDHESLHLVDSYHLVRPKSRAGYRVAPLLKEVREVMLKWRDVAPASPHNLVWPEPNGRPRNDKHDRAEWWELQERAGVAHPNGRPYHVHECRNFAATMLLEAGVPEHVVTDLLGHTSVATSLRYRTRRREPLLEAMQLVGERLQLSVRPE
ncbi:tyrosine recombinase XerC [Nocardioides sp. OK12]|uniref:site-specific integrase n=1 Tax=Nocardioides sp. OK12 TaxID=2758661 RepID=UPI0021C3B8F7|nr:site-specific integrase [Nocardioides sp. OK12]